MAKCGAKKKDYRGFDNVVARVKKLISKNGEASLIYVKGKGFVVRKTISEKMRALIDNSDAELVCAYNNDINRMDVADDCVFTLDQMGMYER